MSDTVKRKLVITACTPLATFTNKRNEEQQIWEIQATDEAGVKITEKLRSFTQLDTEKLTEFEVSPYNHPKYGQSFTLKVPGKQSGLAKSVDELRARVDKLDEQCKWLYERVQAIAGADVPGPSPKLESEGSGAPPELPAPPPPAGDPAPEDEIPF